MCAGVPGARQAQRAAEGALPGMGRLLTIKTLTGFDFSFQPSLDRNRILTLAGLDFISRHEVVHFLGQPGCSKTHLAIALAVEAVQAGRSVYFTTLAELIGSLAKAEREGTLRERIRFLCRPQLLVVDEIGYLPATPGGANLFFQLVNARYENGRLFRGSNAEDARVDRSSPRTGRSTATGDPSAQDIRG